MSFLWKVFLISVAILVFIIGTTVGTSLYFIHRGIQETILSDLAVIARIAEKLVSSEINLIKARAWTSVHLLDNVPLEQWPAVMEQEVEASEAFLSLTVFNVNGALVASYGDPLTPVSLMSSHYAKMAMEGQTVISTTRSLPTGELVIHVCVPLDKERVASISIPGLYFSRILSRYHIWDTGTVFILDETGKIIANEREHLVLGEYNSLEDDSDDINVVSFRDFCRAMIKGGQGTGRYVLENQERLGYFVSVTGSNVGWSLGVSAPLSESPLNYVDRAIVLMTLVFLSIGLLIAWLTSGFVSRQFNLINQQYINLSELSDIARSSSEAKTNFLANMSHEMRTPLNAIIGFSELMIYGRYDSEERRENLEKIHAAGLTLLGIVNDILDISKIESGHFELIEVEYDVSSLINDTVTVNLIRIGEKPIEFGLEIDKSIPSRLFGDELRIKQICTNILSNAFKYTLEGTVNMFVTCEQQGETVWLSIEVKDTGIGIKPEDLSKLFSAYSQVDTKSNRKIEGTGLGLSITKKMVDMMDGRIEVESEYGKGTTFTVIIKQRVGKAPLPLGQEGAKSLENIRLYKSIHSGRDREIVPMPYAKILLVDDVQANLDVAMGVLKPYKMRVDCVTSGQTAVDLIREENVIYDAVFMDHMMPGMDGIEAVRHIREEIGTEYAKTVPIIALTANAIIGNDKMFLENGFQAYLTKPIEIYRMDVVLKKYVRDPEKEKDQGPETAASGATAAKASANGKIYVEGLDLVEAIDRFGGDEEVLVTVLRSYAEYMPDLLSRLENPDKNNLKDYTITVHGIKSSSYGVGAKEVGDLAKELEARSDAGDFDFVVANNRRFIRMTEKQIVAINEALKDLVVPGVSLPQKTAPDPEVLKRLREASLVDDMDGMEAAIEELEKYEYQENPGFVPWLKDMVDQFALAEIAKAIDENGVIAGQPEDAGAVSKPEAEEPDWLLLTRLAKAAENFDMDKVDSAMEELTAYVYRKNNDLVEWLRDKVNSMEFADVSDKITSLAKTVTPQTMAVSGSKPLKGAPDPKVLERLKTACQDYDMDGVDVALAELEGFSYSEGEELVVWLKNMVAKMEFMEIQKKLSGETT
ncbi:MAG: response regulator [Deltaproteobacteria bacterium]|jgi:signal transduction histidine kinase/CheY-like chemotaxis protein|nr:response regulator [Deltaproteobacteria bacterium]